MDRLDQWVLLESGVKMGLKVRLVPPASPALRVPLAHLVCRAKRVFLARKVNRAHRAPLDRRENSVQSTTACSAVLTESAPTKPRE